MSLINKMLQDLEERRAEERGADGFHPQVRAAAEGARPRLPWLIIVAAVIPLVAAGAWYWGRQSAPVSASGQQAPVRPQLALKLAPQLDSSAVLAQHAPAEKTKLPAASTAPAVGTPTALMPDRPSAAGDAPAALPMPSIAAAATLPPEKKSAGAASPAFPSRVVQAAAKEGSARPSGERPAASEEKKRLAPVKEKFAQSTVSKESPQSSLRAAADKPGAEPVLHFAKQMEELTPQQRAENEYRRATLLMQQQRSAEAMAALEQALQLDPLHAAARQALAGLLVDAKRNDDAMRRLEEGLAADRTQPGLAMMLARLQVEKKELKPAIDTLQRTLPYAADRADYQAFLAALFQRDGRHKDAIAHYLLALRNTPQNGLWWMGLAISLQAENRVVDAREAYNRAKASNMLSPDLAMFVDQRLAQLR